jgi:hypothetical protein
VELVVRVDEDIDVVKFGVRLLRRERRGRGILLISLAWI